MPSAQRGAGAVEHGGGRGWIHQAAEGEFGFLVRVGGQRKIAVFDARILAELALEGEQRAQGQGKPAGYEPSLSHKADALFSLARTGAWPGATSIV
jgi:hypothetical protein